MYADGSARGDPQAFEAAAALAPYDRAIREGPAHFVMVFGVQPSTAISVIERALKNNPHSADMHLALMKLKTGTNDAKGAFEAFDHLRRLLPKEILTKAVLGSVAVTDPPL